MSLRQIVTQTHAVATNEHGNEHVSLSVQTKRANGEQGHWPTL